MKRYVTVLPIEEVSGPYVHQLPLHCTVLGPFESEIDVECIVSDLKGICYGHGPIRITSLAPDRFGKRRTVPVHVVEKTVELQKLHTDVLTWARQVCANVIDNEWIGEGYRPHVTTTKFAAFPPYTTYVARKVALFAYEPIQGVKRPRRRQKTLVCTCSLDS